MEHIHRDIKKEIAQEMKDISWHNSKPKASHCKATIEILKDRDMMEQIIESERNHKLGRMKKFEF